MPEDSSIMLMMVWTINIYIYIRNKNFKKG